MGKRNEGRSEVPEMTYEEKKEFRSGYIEGKRRIAALLRDWKYWQDVGTSMGANSGEGHGSGAGSKVETAAVKIADIQREIEFNINDCDRLRKEVRNAVERLRTSKYKTALYDIYIAGISRDTAANERGISVGRLNSMIHRAIDQLDI